MGNEFKSIASQDGSCSVDVGEYAGDYKIVFKVGGVERGTIDDTGLFEIDHIHCRGTISTANFEADTISVVGGSVIVRPGDTLSSDMTALDTSTLTIAGNETFAVSEILRIKDGINDEWFEVTNISSAPTYVVTRDKEAVYAANSNPAWTKGCAVVNYGISGDGGVLLTSSLPHAPYVSIFTHEGSPWSSITEEGRFGNLNGYLGYGTDIYGVGIGSSTTNEANLTFDATNGLRIRHGLSNIISLDMSGNAKISNFYIDSTAGLYAGSGNTRVQMSPGAGFWCGATAQGDAPFRVTVDGSLTATSVNISGELITEDGSEINGQYIGDTTIPGCKLFNATITGDKIGNATITGGNIANGTITGSNITNGSITGGDIDTGTITGGNISSSTITGGNMANQTITAGQIENLTITASQIANLTITGGSGGQIAGSTLSEYNIVANTITANSIAADAITASELAANSVTANSIVANTITASEVAANAFTASELNGSAFGTLTISSGKISINTTDALEITSGGNLKVLAGGTIDLIGSGTSAGSLNLIGSLYKITLSTGAFGTITRFYPDDALAPHLYIGDSTYMWKRLYLTSSGNTFIQAYKDATNYSSILFDSESIIENVNISVCDTGTLSNFIFYKNKLALGTNNLIDLGDSAKQWRYIYAGTSYKGPLANNGAYIQCRAGNRISFEWASPSLKLYVDSTHVKTFVINHPTKSEKYLVHGTLEGPEACVFYRGTQKLKGGYAEVSLPDYFEALTHTKGRTIILTMIDSFDKMMIEKQDGEKIKNGMFIIRSENPYSYQEFDWEVKAIRKDVKSLTVEPDKSGCAVKGIGPYTYIN